MVKQIFTVIIILFLTECVFAQNQDSIAKSKYLEDQLYLGVTYNLLLNQPDSISTNGLSNGLFFGFIKDIPLNKRRNFGFGIGLGYGRNTFYQNLQISKENNQTTFQPVKGNFTRNKFSLHAIELPVELRIRTSTTEKYKFWRFYSGVKFAYVFANNSRLDQNGKFRITNIKEINKFQYGLTLAIGYGTWNFNVYYGLQDIFSDAYMNYTQEKIQLNDVRVGLVFYIL